MEHGYCRMELWERVGFLNGRARTWERSTDFGKTWEPVPWPGGEPPFIMMNVAGFNSLDAIWRWEIPQKP